MLSTENGFYQLKSDSPNEKRIGIGSAIQNAGLLTHFLLMLSLFSLYNPFSVGYDLFPKFDRKSPSRTNLQKPPWSCLKIGNVANFISLSPFLTPVSFHHRFVFIINFSLTSSGHGSISDCLVQSQIKSTLDSPKEF